MAKAGMHSRNVLNAPLLVFLATQHTTAPFFTLSPTKKTLKETEEGIQNTRSTLCSHAHESVSLLTYLRIA